MPRSTSPTTTDKLLYEAALGHYDGIVRALLRFEADIYSIISSVSATTLEMAADAGYLMQTLLAARSDVNTSSSKGTTALGLATQRRRDG